MAEIVQLNMESMIPELEEYVKYNLFTKEEVANIVKKRKNYEYAIKKHNLEVSEFLRYIQYEINLDLLQKKRRAKIPPKMLKNATLTSYIARKRINFIFQRALRKFTGDIGIWLLFIEWEMKHGSPKALSNTLNKAVQLHPTKPVIWLKFANWEYDFNGNVDAARVLFQRGLRANPNSEHLWLSFFKMEIAYLEKLKERSRILGSIKTIPNEKADNQKEFIDNEDVIGLEEVPDTNNEILGGMLAEKDDFFSGVIPATIFKNAITKISNNLQFRCKFYDILPNLQVYDSLKQLIDSTILNDFKDDSECWKMYINRNVNKSKLEKTDSRIAASAVYEQAIISCPELHQLYIDYGMFLENIINDLLASEEKLDNEIDYFSKLLLKVIEVGLKNNVNSEYFYQLSSRTYLNFGNIEMGKICLVNGLKFFPDSISLLKDKVTLDISSALISKDYTSVEKEYKFLENEVIRLLPSSVPMLNQLMEYCFQLTSMKENSFELVDKSFKKILVKFISFPPSSEFDDFRKLFLNYNLIQGGVVGWRKSVDYLFSIPGLSVTILETMIEIEIKMLPSVRDPKREILLFEKLVNLYGDDHDTWIYYIEYSLKNNPMNVSLLYLRALKNIKNVNEFMAIYETLKQSK